MSDLDYKDYKEDTSYFEFESCPKCGKSSLSPFARVNSLHFANFVYYFLRCGNPICNNSGWVVIDRSQEAWDKKVLFVLTTKKPNPPSDKKVPLAAAINSYLELPENVFHDFDQAYQCLLSELYDAAVCMARRALERVLIDKGATEYTLFKKIKQLEEQGKLPPETSSLCDDVREFGKKGAHAYEPITAKDADYAIMWTDIIIAWLYGYIEPTPNNSKS